LTKSAAKKKNADDIIQGQKAAKKKTEDFSDLVAEKIPEYTSLAANGKFGEAIEKLLQLEKKTRQGGDAISTAKVLCAIAEICHQKNEHNALNENIIILSKRRGLLKESIKQLVIKCMSFLDEMKYDPKMALIKTLLEVTEGKIFVEKQRARLTLILAKIKESEGDINEAAKILQEVQIETFGAMKKKEKTEYILEQMRLCLLKKDYVRTQIISKKINPKVLHEDDFQEINIKFNELMIQYYINERKHIEIAKCYNQIYNTPLVKSDPAKWGQALKLIVFYLILAEFDNEQSDFSHRLNQDPNLDKIPEYKNLLNLFLTHEVIHQEKIEQEFSAELTKLPPFSDKEETKHLWADLKQRVIEHNIRVVARYYTRIRANRLSQLLSLDIKETEKHVSRLVVKGSVFAKIDRPHGIITFKKSEAPSDVLNKWSSDIESLLKIVENSCHLIQRENMVHKKNLK